MEYGSKEIEIPSLSGRGEIWSFTVVRDAPAGFEKYAPYVVAMVKLTEGPLVTAMLTDIDTKDVYIGMSVEVVTRELRQLGETGLIVYGYKFRPPIPESGETLAETIARINGESDMVYKVGSGLVKK